MACPPEATVHSLAGLAGGNVHGESCVSNGLGENIHPHLKLALEVTRWKSESSSDIRKYRNRSFPPYPYRHYLNIQYNQRSSPVQFPVGQGCTAISFRCAQEPGLVCAGCGEQGAGARVPAPSQAAEGFPPILFLNKATQKKIISVSMDSPGNLLKRF